VLRAKIKACRGFRGKRSFVLWHLETFSEGHQTLEEADPIIQGLRKHPEPGDESLQFQNQELANAVLKLKRTKVNEIRNRFEHEGYQPPREEAAQAVAKAREILLPLGSLLEIHADANLYSSGTPCWGISRARIQQ
jgi:hypothetical protein